MGVRARGTRQEEPQARSGTRISTSADARFRLCPGAVPDLSNFYDQHKAVMPFLITKEGVDTTVENYQSKEDRAKLDGEPQNPNCSWSREERRGQTCVAARTAPEARPEAEAERRCACGRPVRVRALRVLHHIVPLVLVELGQVFGAGGAAAVVPLAGGQPRRQEGGAAQVPRRRLQGVPVSHHHELQQDLPEGARPRPRPRPRHTNPALPRAAPFAACTPAHSCGLPLWQHLNPGKAIAEIKLDLSSRH